jgi:ribosomal protein L12E/L44/L45/RPP1/RPP2
VCDSYKEKEVALNGHFHVSSQELCDAANAAEMDTRKQAGREGKKKAKIILHEAEGEEEAEEEAQEESDSDNSDCIIVDVK